MVDRRTVIKSLFIASGLACLAPFFPMGKFLTPESQTSFPRQKVGNIEDIPVGGQLFVVYPKTGDPAKDTDPFRQFVIIRLSENELYAYSRVCIHLWCLVDYKNDKNLIECPCHGSQYDPKSGFAVAGPASKQPNRYLPILKIEVDENGDIYAIGIEGEIGYGR